MAHKKAGGSSANQTGNVQGKRRGIKKYSGERVVPGNIIVRQLGTKYHPGNGVGMGKDFTIFAKINGIVEFKYKTKTKKVVNVLQS